MEDGKAVCRPVRIGPSSLSETIISEGLPPESVVIVGPYKALESLEDGDAVRETDGSLRDGDEETSFSLSF